MRFRFDFNDRTLMLPLLDAYISTQLPRNYNTALEIGVYKGGWLFNLLNNIPQILTVGIDPYPNLEKIRDSLINKRDQLGFKKNLVLLSSFDELSSSEYALLTYDVIHCDGEHSQSQVKQDLENALPRLKEDGILIIDDIFYHSYPGVTAAAFDFIRSYELSPFLFTEKKLYICHPIYLEHYYKKTINMFNALNVNFEENEKTRSGISYFQSNSIFGYNLIITSETSTRRNFKALLDSLALKEPLLLKAKNSIKLYLPPKILELYQVYKSS